MNFKALAAAVVITACGSASAATINLGTFDDDTAPLAFNHKTASVLGASQSFTDYVDFQLNETNDASFSLTFANLGKYKLTLDSWSLTEIGGGAIASQAGSTFADISYADLASGSYQLAIHGTLLKGFKGNSYGGNAVTAVVAVPEPETYALMLAGLGVVGVIARRRRST